MSMRESLVSDDLERVAQRPKSTNERRMGELEAALGQIAVDLHIQHLMPFGPSWDGCQHRHCLAAKRLLPELRLDRIR